MRIVQIYTIIAGSSIAIFNSPQKAVVLTKIKEADCAEIYNFEIEDEMVNEFPTLRTNFSCNNATVSFYAPRVFKSLIKADEKMVDIEASFDIVKNWNNIKKNFAGPDGGRRYDQNKYPLFKLTLEQKILFHIIK